MGFITGFSVASFTKVFPSAHVAAKRSLEYAIPDARDRNPKPKTMEIFRFFSSIVFCNQSHSGAVSVDLGYWREMTLHAGPAI